MDPELLERITARRAELDELEEQLAKQLAEVRAERDELAVAEKVLERMSKQPAEDWTVRAVTSPGRPRSGPSRTTRWATSVCSGQTAATQSRQTPTAVLVVPRARQSRQCISSPCPQWSERTE
ncbi:hypothetical protein ACFYO6_19190 [Streptomyces anthocyanicus]|uniref:Uncharacterized protein n=1 Tax=Streptomyces lividans 1326 TaxID=1200984 RepID=A0A7U9H8X3_STRLI|nr:MULTISPECIES: hypothetical protein [Streptomyces]EOY45793.1 hypothetical protein SLI_1076 [Streptomyces lividans 1326]